MLHLYFPAFKDYYVVFILSIVENRTMTFNDLLFHHLVSAGGLAYCQLYHIFTRVSNGKPIKLKMYHYITEQYTLCLKCEAVFH